jgi:hypothetical protein
VEIPKTQGRASPSPSRTWTWRLMRDGSNAEHSTDTSLAPVVPCVPLPSWVLRPCSSGGHVEDNGPRSREMRTRVTNLCGGLE